MADRMTPSGMTQTLLLLAPGIVWMTLQDHPASPPDNAEAAALARLLFYLLVVVVVFLFGSYAIMRASRRFRGSLSARRSEPTETGDVWAMHKVPQELEPDDDAG